MTDGNGKDVTLPGIDPFVSYGGGGSGITGGAQLLIYSKGEYNYGIDRVNLPLGTKMVFNVPGVMAGYRKWVNNQIASEDMELLVDRPRLPPRNNYDATDTREWEGNRDPWQETIVFDVTDGQGETYAFPLSGVGGVRAAKALILDYGKGRRSRPDQLPLVQLDSGSYPHPKYGKIHHPILSIVGWVDGDSLSPVEDVAGGDLPWDRDDAASGDDPTDKPVEPAAIKAAPAKTARAPRF